MATSHDQAIKKVNANKATTISMRAHRKIEVSFALPLSLSFPNRGLRPIRFLICWRGGGPQGTGWRGLVRADSELTRSLHGTLSWLECAREAPWEGPGKPLEKLLESSFLSSWEAFLVSYRGAPCEVPWESPCEAPEKLVGELLQSSWDGRWRLLGKLLRSPLGSSLKAPGQLLRNLLGKFHATKKTWSEIPYCQWTHMPNPMT